jgi:hypothetical protein
MLNNMVAVFVGVTVKESQHIVITHIITCGMGFGTTYLL